MKYWLGPLAVMLALTPSGAGGTSLGYQFIDISKMSLAKCMARARRAIDIDGYGNIRTDGSAVWADNDTGFIAVVHCYKARNVAVVAVAGPDLRATELTRNAIVSTWEADEDD